MRVLLGRTTLLKFQVKPKLKEQLDKIVDYEVKKAAEDSGLIPRFRSKNDVAEIVFADWIAHYWNTEERKTKGLRKRIRASPPKRIG